MYKLTDSINRAIKQCLDHGNGEICLLDGEKTVIFADWEEWDQDNNYDAAFFLSSKNTMPLKWHRINFQ